MKSNANRSADYANVLQTLITSAKLLQEATESSTQPIASGPLLDVAIDRLETLKVRRPPFRRIGPLWVALSAPIPICVYAPRIDPRLTCPFFFSLLSLSLFFFIYFLFSQTLKANRDLGEELAEKIVYQVSAIFHELSRPTASEDSSRLLSESVTRYTTYVVQNYPRPRLATLTPFIHPAIICRITCSALTEAHDALTRLTHRGTLGKSIMRGRDRRELQGLTTAMDEEYNVFMVGPCPLCGPPSNSLPFSQETIGKQQGRQREFRRSLHIGSAAGFDVAGE